MVLKESDALGPIAALEQKRTFNPWVDSSSLSGPTQYTLTLVAS
jgi:hypothetical protein